MHAELAKSKGARVILAESSPMRLAVAKEFEFDHYLHTQEVDLAQEVLNLTHGEGTDVGIVACSVTKIAEELLEAMAMKGRLSLFAGFPKKNSSLRLDGNILHYKEVSIYGAFASSRPHFEQALRIIVDRVVSMDRIVTHVFPLEKILEAMEKMLDKKGDALKVVVKP